MHTSLREPTSHMGLALAAGLAPGQRVHYCTRSGRHLGDGTICGVSEDFGPDGEVIPVYHVRIETRDGGQHILWGYANQFRPAN